MAYLRSLAKPSYLTVLLSTGAVLGLVAACSDSGNDLKPTVPAGSTTTGGQGGSAAGTTGGTTDGMTATTMAETTGATTGDSTSTSSSTDGASTDGATSTTGGGTCAEACVGGATCQDGVCACPSSRPDLCVDTCVKLETDPGFCGDCATACDAGAACVAGVCGVAPTELATIESCGELQVTHSAGSLYLTNNTGDAAGTVLSLPVAGGTPTEIAAGQDQPMGVSADATGVYWATADGSIMKAPLPSGTPEALVTGLDPRSFSTATANDLVFYSSGDLMYKIATSGDATEGTYVTCTPLDGVARALYADATRLYWTSDLRQAVETDEQSDGVAADVCAELGDEGYIELGESQGSLLHDTVYSVAGAAYWASGDLVRRAALENPTNETLAFTLDADPITGLFVNEASIYFAGEQGTVQKVDLAAPADPLPIAVGQDAAHSLTADDTNLYWVTGDCKVMALPL